MIFIIALLLALALTLLCGPALRRCPGAFYTGAAIVSGVVIALYWAAPELFSLALRTRLPVWLGAFGTACFAVTMYAGALPNGSKLTKAIMPVRGELSIKYKDGAYSGSAKGYEGTITVSVTISGDKITDISIVSCEDDDEYMNPARAVVSAILSAQSPNVSAVSGATYSSKGIMNAVNAVLKKALN